MIQTSPPSSALVCSPTVALQEFNKPGVDKIDLPWRDDVAPRDRSSILVLPTDQHQDVDRRVLASWSHEDRPRTTNAHAGGGVLVSYDDGSRRDGWSRSAMRGLPGTWGAISGRADAVLYWAVDFLDSLVGCPRRQRLHWHDSPSGFADLFIPERPQASLPLVIMLHGGFWREAWTLDTTALTAADLAADGYHVLNVEYPAVGIDVAHGGDLVNDLVERLPHLIEELLTKLDCRPALVITGHSAGGQLALLLAEELSEIADIAGVVAHGAILDVVAAWEEGIGMRAADLLVSSVRQSDRPKVLEYISPLHSLRSIDWPTLVIHGHDDERVPVDHAIRFCERFDVESMLWDSVPHLDYLSPQTPSWKATREWIQQRTQ